MLELSELLTELQSNTEQAVYERALSNAVFYSIGDGAIATDEDGIIRRINQAALDILGLTKKQTLGHWFPKTIIAVNQANEIVPAIDRLITKSFITGQPISGRTYYRTKKDPRLPVFVTVSPTMLNNKPVGAVEIFRDITQEYKVDQMKSEFISIASHQLRTPLSAINTYTQMLSGGYAGHLTDEQKEFMKIIISSIERMNELINELLDIARIESGKLRINSAAIDYKDIINSIIDESKALTDSKHIKLLFVAPDRPVEVTADPLLLKEVCANLLSNALKYTPHKGKVTISLKEDRDSAILCVKDTGYGIPKASQNNMFSKFFRAGNVIQKETHGTGLGLYMVRLIADSMGGKVWFNSRENKGSEFYFSFPISIQQQNIPQNRENSYI